MSFDTQNAKADKGKLPITFVPTQIIRDVARIRQYGNDKYHSPANWVIVEKDRYKDALMRHLLAYIDDENSVDSESGLLHLWHAACNIAFLCEMARPDWEEMKQKIIDRDPEFKKKLEQEKIEMGVTQFDKINNAISVLRREVYNTDAFKTTFASKLANSIFAIDTNYIPEVYGGWSINVIVNRDKGISIGINSQSSNLYVERIIESLIDTITEVGSNIDYLNEVASNLANIVVTGEASIVIKI